MENSEEINQYFGGKSTFSFGLIVEFKLFQNVRDLVDTSKIPMQIKKFHYQGSDEYSAAESNEV